MGVPSGVGDHGRGKRPGPPVRELKRLVRGDVAEVFQQVGEALGVVERGEGLAGVEEVADVEPKVALEPLDVLPGAVEDFGDGGGEEEGGRGGGGRGG